MKCIIVFIFSLLATPLICNALDLCDIAGNYSKDVISEQCMNQLKIVCQKPSLQWKFFDASSKYPLTGMSYSNNRDFGNFDECLSINHESFEGKVIGKYCAFSVVILNPLLKSIPSPFGIAVAPDASGSKLSEERYFGARNFEETPQSILISTLSSCVPNACTPREVGRFFISKFLENITIIYTDESGPKCMTTESNSTFEWKQIVFICFLSLILLLIVLSTSYDILLHRLNQEAKQPVYLAFSIMTNGKKLFHINHTKNPEQIQCLNGIRFISMMWVISGHGFVAQESLPLINYAEIKAYADSVKIQYAASAPIAVDTFFFLSGFLLTFGYIKATTKKSIMQQIGSIPLMILHRYLRLTPALAVLFFAMLTIYPMMGTGPLWGTMTSSMGEQCEKQWWPFFLYIQNYVNYKDMCLNHSWYLSADMQMFMLAPLVLIPLTVLLKREKTFTAIMALLGLTVVWVILPMLIRFLDDSIDNVYDTHSRFNDYLIGVILGVILRQYKDKPYPFKKPMNFLIWATLLTACFFYFSAFYHDVVRHYDHTKDTLFYGTYRPLWCGFLAWLVYSCYHGYGGPINWILSRPIFQVGARLSYCMYLLHAIVEAYWVGIARNPVYWGDYSIFYAWCGHFIVTMIISTIWSLAFESPMITIEKFLFGGAISRKFKSVFNLVKTK